MLKKIKRILAVISVLCLMLSCLGFGSAALEGNASSAVINHESAGYLSDIEDAMTLLDANVSGELPESNSGLPVFVIIIIIAVVVLAAVVVLVIVLRKKTGQKGQTSANGGNASNQDNAASKASDDSGYRIIGTEGALAGKRIMIKKSGTVVFGRNAGMCSVAIPNAAASVSSRHCEIWFNGSEVCIRDAGSTHGTFVSPGRKLAPNETAVLSENDSFWLGTEEQKFKIGVKKS